MMRYFKLTFPLSYYRKPGFYDNRSDSLRVSTKDQTLRTSHLAASEMSTTIINSREYVVINHSGLHQTVAGRASYRAVTELGGATLRGRSESSLLSKRPSYILPQQWCCKMTLPARTVSNAELLVGNELGSSDVLTFWSHLRISGFKKPNKVLQIILIKISSIGYTRN